MAFWVGQPEHGSAPRASHLRGPLERLKSGTGVPCVLCLIHPHPAHPTPTLRPLLPAPLPGLQRVCGPAGGGTLQCGGYHRGALRGCAAGGGCAWERMPTQTDGALKACCYCCCCSPAVGQGVRARGAGCCPQADRQMMCPPMHARPPARSFPRCSSFPAWRPLIRCGHLVPEGLSRVRTPVEASLACCSGVQGARAAGA